MSKQVNYNENLCSGAAIRDDKGRRISKLFEASHPKMTVGYAKNLIMPDTPTEQEFNFRQSGGGVIEDGVAVIDKVKGNSVVWNQLLGGEYGTLEIELIPNGAKIIKGHKYLLYSSEGDDAAATLYLYFRKDGVSEYYCAVHYNTRIIFTAIADGDASKGANVEGGLWFYKAQTAPIPMRIFLTDLTQMFGAGNEPTTYEEFLSRKPKVADEYAYNEGTIVSNKVEKVKVTGVNLWDEEWEVGSLDGGTGQPIEAASVFRSKNYCPILGRTEYYLTSASFLINIFYYDKDKNFLAGKIFYGNNVAFTTPEDAAYFKVRTDSPNNIYNHDICINFSDPAINGQYFPYEKHELDLAWVKDIKDGEGVKLFEDGVKSAGTAFDEVRKDKAVKRIAVSTFNGTEDWRINAFAQEKGIMAYQCYGKLIPINDNIRCDRFVTRSWSSSLEPMSIFAIPENGIIIEADGAQSLDDFKASLVAKPLDVYYELAEPIEVEYDEKNLTYPVVAGGTEEAIASEPSTAFRADIGYGIDAVKTILDLKARVEALETK